MGQAKKRGTFEQRRKESIIREELRKESERLALAESREKQRIHDLKNPQQAAERKARSHRTAMLLGAILGMSAIGVSRAKPAKETSNV